MSYTHSESTPAQDVQLVKELPRYQMLLQDAQMQIAKMGRELAKLTANPLGYGTVVLDHPDTTPWYEKFKIGDQVRVTKQGPYFGMLAVIEKHRFGSKNDKVVTQLKMSNGDPVTVNVQDYLEQKLPVPFESLQLSQEDYCIVISGQSIYQVKRPDFPIHPGMTVVLNLMTNAIVAPGESLPLGEYATVTEAKDGKLSVDYQGNQRCVLPGEFSPQKDDRVLLDPTGFVVLAVVPKEQRFKFQEHTHVTWADIGGLSEAKREFQQIVADFGEPSSRVDKAYKKRRRVKGVLLYGPPGNGKTLLAKAAATMLAKEGHAGFFAIRGPEVLSRYVGDTEAAIRQVFAQARVYKEKTGKPGVVFFDEADSLLPVRGSGISTDVFNTIVPTFLTEQDGIAESGALVVLATNRAELLDPAVTRDGRIDRKLYIGAPSEKDATDILAIHLMENPLACEFTQLCETAVKELFDDKYVLYHLHAKSGKIPFRLKQATSGALLAGIADRAVQSAYRRDAQSKKINGVTPDDVVDAVKKSFSDLRNLNATEYIKAFAQELGEPIQGYSLAPLGG